MAASEAEQAAYKKIFDEQVRIMAIKYDMVPRARAVKFLWIAGLSGFAFGVAGSLLGCLAAGWL